MFNKKVVGKFKDELKGNDMEEFVGLRAKMYSFRYNDDEVKKLKGIKKTVVQRDIHFAHYKTCLFERLQYKARMNMFRIQKHLVQSVCQNKTLLSCFDDKRYILEDGVLTLPNGHFEIDSL